MSLSPIPKFWGLSCMFPLLVSALLALPAPAGAETLGARDAGGTFVPKVTVTVKDKEVLIKKVDPRAKFDSISLTVNKKNPALLRNTALLKLQWLTADNQGAKPVPFAGPLYNAASGVFKDSMTRSATLKIIDSSTKDLFAGKQFNDLFTLHVDEQLCLSSEAFHEKEGTVKLGTGSDLSLDVDKNKVAFNESNIRKGEIINVDNRSGYNQTVGVTFPSKGLLYHQIIRKPEQTKVPRESWDRFTVEGDSGFFIVLIPESDPAQLTSLQGKELLIKVWDGARVRETKRLPISVMLEGAKPSPDPSGGTEESRPDKPEKKNQSEGGAVSAVPAGSGINTTRETLPRKDQPSPASTTGRTNVWFWGAFTLNLILVIAVGSYALFFLLPRVQALEDRTAKAEMFIHGSREAIREELQEMKRDVLSRRPENPSSKE